MTATAVKRRKSQKARLTVGALAVCVYVGCVLLANYVTTRYGFVPVGFGQVATAGTFAAGGALVVRDIVQDAVGRVGVLVLIAVAAALSYLISDPFIASASACAFLVSECLDMLLYTPLRMRGKFGSGWWRCGVAAGGVAGAVADTLVFLTIAFGWSAVAGAVTGQLIGKAEVLLALIVIGQLVRRPATAVLDR